MAMFRYLLDVRWFKQWKKYVGFDSGDQQEMGLEATHPGPVDTSCLLKRTAGHYCYILMLCSYMYSCMLNKNTLGV